MKIKRFNETKKGKEEENEISFDIKSFEKEKDEKPSFKTSLEDQEKIQKEFEKELDKIEKFESFITINIDHVDNIKYETELEDNDGDFNSESEESETKGCGCCNDCSGEEGCECCDKCSCSGDVNIKKASEFVNTLFSENLKWHLDNNKPVTESIFRPGSKEFFNVIKEARQLFDLGKVELCDIDKELYESTEIGNFGYFNGELVPLDLPMEMIEELNEAEYKGKKVKLNHPMRNSGGGKKYYVYVKNPKTGNVKKISFGDVHGGLTAKVSNPEARRSFAARHKCSTKKDKTKAGYWACRINKYGHLWGGKTYPGYW